MEPDKQTPTPRFLRHRQLSRLLRYLEAIATLLVLSYSFHILMPPNNPGDFLRFVSDVIVSPSFVFLLGNAIILLLFAKSGQLSSSSESISCEFVVASYPPPPPHLGPMEEVLYEDKAVCVEIRAFGRSQSEKIERVQQESKLRRADTAVLVRERNGVSAHDGGESEEEEDAEQFRRTIEEFIAKHQRFQREESLAVVSFSAGLPEPVAS